jgi:hypothetical protein
MARLWPLIVAALVSSSGCGDRPGTPTVVYDKPTLDAKYKAVTDLAAARACSATSQCASIAIGAKPCGGPWRYLVYSRVNVNETELRTRVDDLFAFEREYNMRNGVASDCSLAQPANPGCVDGICVDLNAR